MERSTSVDCSLVNRHWMSASGRTLLAGIVIPGELNSPMTEGLPVVPALPSVHRADAAFQPSGTTSASRRFVRVSAEKYCGEVTCTPGSVVVSVVDGTADPFSATTFTMLNWKLPACSSLDRKSVV